MKVPKDQKQTTKKKKQREGEKKYALTYRDTEKKLVFSALVLHIIHLLIRGTIHIHAVFYGVVY